jgi:hypothetical protein
MHFVRLWSVSALAALCAIFVVLSAWLLFHLGFDAHDCKLLALSLCCTLAAAVLFQPALMGRPRTIRDT